jgi:hypothetical protein
MKVIDLTARFSKGVTFKCEPWKLSPEAEARIKEIENNHRRALRELQNYWFD